MADPEVTMGRFKPVQGGLGRTGWKRWGSGLAGTERVWAEKTERWGRGLWD